MFYTLYAFFFDGIIVKVNKDYKIGSLLKNNKGLSVWVVINMIYPYRGKLGKLFIRLNVMIYWIVIY